MRFLKGTAITGTLALAVAGAASAETYRLSMWSGESEGPVIANRQLAEDLAAATNGEITFEVFSGGVLLPPRSSLQGIGDGVAHAGQATGGYTPTELPLTNAVQGFGFIENDPVAIGAAFADWVMHDPAAQKEWADNKVVPLAGFSTPTYQLICNTSEPITEAEQLNGLKVRSFGLIGTLLTDTGGVPVNIPSSEAYQALQTGQLDCAALGADHLAVSNKLAEVSKFVTMTRWSPAFNSPQLTVNRAFWQSLTNEQRAEIFKHAARAHVRVQNVYGAGETSSLEEAQAMGVVVVEPGESLQTAVQDWVDAGVGDMVGVARNTYGVQDPEALFASFEPYVTKWGELVRGMNDPADEDELTQLFLDHMYNDLDPATYGMD